MDKITVDIKLSELYRLKTEYVNILARSEEIRVPKDEKDLKTFSNKELREYKELEEAKEKANEEIRFMLGLYKKQWEKESWAIINAGMEMTRKQVEERLEKKEQAKKAQRNEQPEKKIEKVTKAEPKIIHTEHKSEPVEKKYRLTGKTTIIDGRVTNIIEAVRDFNDVHAGDLGGGIENEDNLDHNGNCWVYPGAYVCEWAKVTDNARITGGIVQGSAKVGGNSVVVGDSVIREYANVTGSAIIRDSYVRGHAQISGRAYINHESTICGTARIGGEATFFDTYKDDGVYGGRQNYIQGADITPRDDRPGIDYPIRDDDPKFGGR